LLLIIDEHGFVVLVTAYEAQMGWGFLLNEQPPIGVGNQSRVNITLQMKFAWSNPPEKWAGRGASPIRFSTYVPPGWEG
jgi:hypothetical protein